ncbi:hypothetical protein FEM41_20900 [Jejubacter calystegiae]|uniref:Uncharacterized protein n=1 Tax=Jejubacter calystegiae TaxID=2579935 RepID=A0A4P8YQ47_9ENTR|nr:hypothetical protein [Jejubacter calystegiae]QCT21934.1 hypothetical protein FEM41_20900 [Jejubacter calystegiae]
MIGRAVVLVACIVSTSCMAPSSEWNAYLRQVEQADQKTIQALPEKIDSIGDILDAKQVEELTTAISMALIKDPVAVINATTPLEKRTDRLQQRFGMSVICSIPAMAHFTPMQVEAYFAKAEPTLKRAGPAAAECLGTMQYIIDEYRLEMAQGPTK